MSRKRLPPELLNEIVKCFRMEHNLSGVFASSQTLRFFLIPRLNKWAEIRLIALTEAHNRYKVLKDDQPSLLLGFRQMHPSINQFFTSLDVAFTYLNEENLALAIPPVPPNSVETSATSSGHSEPTYDQPPDGPDVNAQRELLKVADRSSETDHYLKVAVDAPGSVVPSRTVHPTEKAEQTRPTGQPPKPPANTKSNSVSIDNSGTESRIRQPTESGKQQNRIPSPPKCRPPPPPAQSAAKKGEEITFGLAGSSPNRLLPSGQFVCDASTAGTSSQPSLPAIEAVEEDDYAEIVEPEEQKSPQKKEYISRLRMPTIFTRRNTRKDTEKK